MNDREDLLKRWDRAATGWSRRADRIRDLGMAVSAWMIDAVQPHPGQRVLELAAGPGDTGFLAAELVNPGGTLLCSDGSEAMLELARSRAQAQGIDNVEFKRLELEWIDLDTASVDAVLCRWGLMLVVDPAAALQEIRRVLRPGGRVALAVWDLPERNPWATVPSRALVELGHAEPPDPDTPGMFALAKPGRLTELLESAGFTDAAVDSVALERARENLDSYFDETLDLSTPFRETFTTLSEADQARVRERIASLAEPFTAADGGVRFPARSLVAYANA